ncbi:hypothetical protein LRY65_05660 [Candidatus Woesebacteria bacterium]|nr:hypothetical protein [Candidatus Woesebacteria bacterium]MCD8506746.1 hypothetical protein [Candidatus Woesebacteria bacterium]MCD8527654.1 hypothetical protein [Candidatus Woesebacteria bacterium]MCD8546376.1 hypothetical protein [Candidatus Woesebacteria bacterium]
MPELTRNELAIEDLRRRAKDNKAQNAAQFATLSESYLDKTRNVLFLISFAILTYLGAIQKTLTTCETVFLLASIIFGIVSYLGSYRYAWALSRYYSDLERNLARAFPSQEEYNQMLLNESSISTQHSRRHVPQFFALGFLLAQALVLFSTLLGIFI